MYKNKFVFAVSLIVCLFFASACFAGDIRKLGTVKYGTHIVNYREKGKGYASKELRLKWKDWLECFAIVI